MPFDNYNLWWVIVIFSRLQRTPDWHKRRIIEGVKECLANNV